MQARQEKRVQVKEVKPFVLQLESWSQDSLQQAVFFCPFTPALPLQEPQGSFCLLEAAPGHGKLGSDQTSKKMPALVQPMEGHGLQALG